MHADGRQSARPPKGNARRGSTPFKKASRASALLHICRQLRNESLPVFYKLTIFDIGGLEGRTIRRRLDTDTCDRVQLIMLGFYASSIEMDHMRLEDGERLSRCDDGVELPSAEHIYLRQQWPLTSTQVSLMKIKNMIAKFISERNILVRGCDLVAFEEPEPAAHIIWEELDQHGQPITWDFLLEVLEW